MGRQIGENGMTQENMWAVVRGYTDGSVDIGQIEKETEKTVSVCLLDWRGEISRNPLRKTKDEILARVPTKEAAEKLVDHAKTMWGQHEKRINDTKSAYAQAVSDRRNYWMAAFQ